MASQAATPMATIMLCPGRPTQRLPRPIGPNKIPRNEDTRPANGRYARGRADIPPSRSCCPAKQGSPTRSNLHSLDSWSAVSCNEGFCNAAELRACRPPHAWRRRNLTIRRIASTAALPSAPAVKSAKPTRSGCACAIKILARNGAQTSAKASLTQRDRVRTVPSRSRIIRAKNTVERLGAGGR